MLSKRQPNPPLAMTAVRSYNVAELFLVAFIGFTKVFDNIWGNLFSCYVSGKILTITKKNVF